MSSNMTSIPESFIQYPVPGIDNDSQGFRDRYATIRSNLNIAKEEIGLLNQNSAKLDENSNFNGNKIIDANLSASTVEVNIALDGDPVTEDVLNISFTEGSVHVIRMQDSITPLSLSFINWPESTAGSDGRFAKIKLIVNPPVSGSRSIAWPADVKRQQISPSLDTQSVISAGSTKIFEVFTYDAGTTLFVSYIGEFE
jgi:hypothetical protein